MGIFLLVVYTHHSPLFTTLCGYVSGILRPS